MQKIYSIHFLYLYIYYILLLLFSPPGEGEGEDEIRAEVLFDRLMMMELKENVSKLDATAYAELKSYKEPPAVVHQILKAVLAMFYVDKANNGEFDDWDRCKKVRLERVMSHRTAHILFCVLYTK